MVPAPHAQNRLGLLGTQERAAAFSGRVVISGPAGRGTRVRVELTVRRPESSTIPLQHGMAGTVDVKVERVAPLTLLVRFRGRTLSGEADATEPRSPTEARRQ
jgi:hypothetical protein